MVRWDGYDETKHDTVLIDEFIGQIPISTLNDWIDIWPFRARLFGGDKEICPKQWVINSNRPPAEWWGGKLHGSPSFHAFKRRVTIESIVATRQELLEAYEQIKAQEARDAQEDLEALARINDLQMAEPVIDEMFPEINDVPVVTEESNERRSSFDFNAYLQ